MSDKHYDDQDEYRYPEDEQSADMETRGDHQPQHNRAEKSGGPMEADKQQHGQGAVSGQPGIAGVLNRIKQLPFLQSKRSIIVLVAVIVLFLLIKLIGGHSSTPNLSKKAQSKPQVTAVTKQNQVMTSQMRDLASQAIQNKRNIAVLTRDMQKVQASMQSINDVVVQLTDEVTNLTKAAKQLQAAPAVKTDQKAQEQKVKVYHITAMVPGRAWVKSTDNNQVTSIRVGDELPTYGKISSIDSNNGVVTTTSGRIIKFGENDS